MRVGMISESVEAPNDSASNPCRHVGKCGVKPGSRRTFAFETPRCASTRNARSRPPNKRAIQKRNVFGDLRMQRPCVDGQPVGERGGLVVGDVVDARCGIIGMDE